MNQCGFRPQCIRSPGKVRTMAIFTSLIESKVEVETSPSEAVAASPKLAPRTVSRISVRDDRAGSCPPTPTPSANLLFGGRSMHFIDLVGAMAAYRHTCTHRRHRRHGSHRSSSSRLSTLAICSSSNPGVNRAFSKSVEVGVKVWAENTRAGLYRHVASAYLVFVAIDDNGCPVLVPELAPETPDERRRYEGAQRRRENRETESERRQRAKQTPAGHGSVRPGKG